MTGLDKMIGDDFEAGLANLKGGGRDVKGVERVRASDARRHARRLDASLETLADMARTAA